jgi:hypothetical protein
VSVNREWCLRLIGFFSVLLFAWTSLVKLYVKTQNDRYGDFYWQGGYGTFSVSPQSIEAVKQYIESQREHHKTITFQDEYRKVLREHNAAFDERYVLQRSSIQYTSSSAPSGLGCRN